MRLNQILFMLIGAAFVSSCDTVQTAPQRGSEKIETASVLPVPAGRGSHEDSGLVMAYEFIDSNGVRLEETGLCRLRLMEFTSRRSYFLNIDRTKTAAFTALPPGSYETGRMGCGMMKVWDLGDIFHGPIRVEAGSASYVGKVSFIFAKNQLQVVEKASRAQHANGFQAAQGAVPQGERIVSGYNLAPLTEEMASEGASASGFDVQAQGIATGPVLNSLLGQLRKCDGVGSKDPLRFGRLDYTATYTKGKFTDFKNRRDANAFNDQFKSCVAETLSSFQPPPTGPVEIHVIY